MSSYSTTITRLINDGMDYLQKKQLHYGEFRTFMSSLAYQEDKAKFISSVFITTFVLYALQFVENMHRDVIINKGVQFLLDEMEPSGWWRFTTTNRHLAYVQGELQIVTPFSILPDLDDTSCASFCLQMNNKIPSPGLNKQLFFDNQNEEGLFQTWLMDAPPYRENCRGQKQLGIIGNDICPGVQCNILLYLGDIPETKAASQYLVNLVQSKSDPIDSLYYENELVLYYIYSRAYFNGVTSLKEGRDAVIEKTLSYSKKDGSFGNPLETALALCSLFNLGWQNGDLNATVDFFMETQNSDYSWPGASFYYCKLYGNPHYGSPELTTAIILEALARLKKFSK